MPDLILLRHAQAAPAAPGTRDHARPLTAHGEDQARAAAHWLAGQGLRPDRILHSSARRAAATAAPVHAALPRAECSAHDEIYEASAGELLRLLETRAGTITVLIGHNPGMQQLLAVLMADAGAPPAMPTAGIGWLRFATAIAARQGRLMGHWTP